MTTHMTNKLITKRFAKLASHSQNQHVETASSWSHIGQKTVKSTYVLYPYGVSV